jgi:hypothetical protein
MAKAKAGGTELPRDLARARQQLDEWRKANARGVSFPTKLWTSAARLAQRHGIYVTSRALGLEYNKLKRLSGGASLAASGRSRTASQKKRVTFIEMSGALPVTATGCHLWLQGPRGERLQLDMAPSAATELVLQLCRSGWAPAP